MSICDHVLYIQYVRNPWGHVVVARHVVVWLKLVIVINLLVLHIKEKNAKSMKIYGEYYRSYRWFEATLTQRR